MRRSKLMVFGGGWGGSDTKMTFSEGTPSSQDTVSHPEGREGILEAKPPRLLDSPSRGGVPRGAGA